jgi:hypothetical protein
MFNCLCINDLFALQRYKNFWTFLLFPLCFKALSTIYLQVGNFSFVIGSVPKNATLVISYLGMKTVEVKAAAEVGRITMQADEKGIGEVVVNGFFTRSKQTYTGAARTISSDEILAVSPNNLF